ncbi:MAG: sodium:calcium antiporter [Phycisphaerae bacterium]|jgi:cation:H+ antiporter|nr:sodium:calcium antiporter [Phycisphaerae bacterium]
MENLIPFSRLAEAGTPGIVLLVAMIVVSIVTLTKGADWLVEGAAQLAYRLGVSKMIVGATVVSLGTTSPETAVSVLAAVQGQSGFALGNAIGSIICDTGLIFGLGCVLTRLPKDLFILNRHGWIQFGAGILIIVMGLLAVLVFGQPVISRGMGVFLLVLLAGYMAISIRWSKQHNPDSEMVLPVCWKPGFCLLMMLIGVSIVVVSAQVLIGSTEQIALKLGIPKSVVSATLVAFGTSLPELMTALASIRKGHPEILIGNIIGADILNVLFVTGASATAMALPIPGEFFYLHFPVMMLVLIIFRMAIMTRGNTFSRWWGLPLLGIYVTYVLVSYLMRSHFQP